ncbi:concanavalin A-like lectin/glucanase domain-containing protein [Parachaetomium inaequale]|uniref:Concanavalin A-like lectin/glucanase domain-containing protein n=1 Tax=Parachaetomium inaequale TaxID=2588326 RepID=A0AAN6PB08_9PEZI|nr:concanavalin A-like lectin/glucanase domain-containing protein [Parachaetomium inaequale]
MRFASYLSLLPILGTSVSAWDAPSYDGYRLVWADTFPGASGSLPNENNWNILDGNLGVNNELQTYRRSTRNVQSSGGNTLQLVPWRDGSSWTSGRLESKYTFTPQAGRRTMAEAQIRFGGNSIDTKQGMWPAFWVLGNSIRSGTPWPACGELDIMETVNGQLSGYGTIHCGVYPGGVCNEPSGRGASMPMPNQDWQRWRIVWDRTSNDWRSETITWFMNDRQFYQVRGDQLNDQNVWASLTAKPLFFILNVAVGGSWPGNPNGNTLDGYGAMMEVGYVAQYSS